LQRCNIAFFLEFHIPQYASQYARPRLHVR
jgi:hypothetical protein